MSKLFFEVFPSLKLEGTARDIMEQAQVERICATKRRDYLRIYLSSRRLIEKEIIWSAEMQITRQLFPKYHRKDIRAF